MKCEELLARLNEYVDGGVEPGGCEQFEKHLAGCNHCQGVGDNIRKTFTLYQEGQPGKDIKPESLALIRKLYPQDEATGFTLGELRGLWRIDFQPTALRASSE